MLVKFRLINGKYAYINPLHVKFVGQGDCNDEAYIFIVGESEGLKVQGTVDEVARKINVAWNT